jgi:hypothetical protein
MSLQSIINICDGLNIDRRKVVGIQYTRNEIPRISQTPTFNPWRFTLSVPSRLRYSEARAILENLDRIDRISPEVISFGANPKLSWIFRYQGVATLSELNTMSVQSFVGNQLVLTNLPALGSSRVLFAPNDLIQIGGYKFPFTSVTEVTRGAGATVTVTTNRPNIIPDNIVGLGITVGSACEFTMFCPNMPTYRLIPGGQLMNGANVLNNALIEFSEDFKLYEYVGTV